MTNFWVAIDHARTELFLSPSGGDVRHDLAHTVEASPALWGLVVPERWSPSTSRACVGVGDIHDRGGLEALRPGRRDETALKVGFGHVGQPCRRTAEMILDRASAYPRVVLEPYCTDAVCLADLATLATEQLCTEIVLKLAVDDGSLACAERAGLPWDGVTWVARSDGMTWEAFSLQLKRARDLGCHGVIAGRAMWGDTVRMSTTQRHATLVRRMLAVEEIFAGLPLSAREEPVAG